jgi:hypothetical protein
MEPQLDYDIFHWVQRLARVAIDFLPPFRTMVGSPLLIFTRKYDRTLSCTLGC